MSCVTGLSLVSSGAQAGLSMEKAHLHPVGQWGSQVQVLVWWNPLLMPTAEWRGESQFKCQKIEVSHWLPLVSSPSKSLGSCQDFLLFLQNSCLIWGRMKHAWAAVNWKWGISSSGLPYVSKYIRQTVTVLFLQFWAHKPGYFPLATIRSSASVTSYATFRAYCCA